MRSLDNQDQGSGSSGVKKNSGIKKLWNMIRKKKSSHSNSPRVKKDSRIKKLWNMVRKKKVNQSGLNAAGNVDELRSNVDNDDLHNNVGIPEVHNNVEIPRVQNDVGYLDDENVHNDNLHNNVEIPEVQNDAGNLDDENVHNDHVIELVEIQDEQNSDEDEIVEIQVGHNSDVDENVQDEVILEVENDVEVGLGACRNPRRIIVKLMGRVEQVEGAYAWLHEEGRQIPFNNGIRSGQLDEELRIQFVEGGIPARIDDLVPAMRAGFITRALPYILQTGIALLVYWAFGTLFYYSMVAENGLIGPLDYDAVDAHYFLMVTMSSTGYGDISASKDSTLAKVVICFMMLIGCGFVAGRLSALFNFFGNALGNWVFGYMGRRRGQPIPESSRVRYRVCFAIAVVALSIGFGIIGGKNEGMGWLDSIYFSVATVSSVGFGDLYYSSQRGRRFAAYWIPVGTTLVDLAFGYPIAARLWSLTLQVWSCKQMRRCVDVETRDLHLFSRLEMLNIL